MKISKSKQELARIISENGGWRDGCEWSVQNGDHGRISFSENKPARQGSKSWMAGGGFKFKIEVCKPLPNWHQTILSREEYFHLYPAPDADGWIEWHGGECPVARSEKIDLIMSDGTHIYDTDTYWGWDACTLKITHYRLHKPEKASPEPAQVEEAKPTIEQLAADYRNAKDYAERKQQEADAAMDDAEAKLAELVAAGKAIGLVLSVAEPELVITDWRDLRAGDEVKAVAPNGGAVTGGEVGFIVKIGDDGFFSNFPSQSQYWYGSEHFNMGYVVFIRRP